MTKSSERPLFIYPKTGSDAPRASSTLPMSIILASAFLPNAVLVDHRKVSTDEIKKLLASEDWTYVGISSMTSPQIRYGLELSELAHQFGHRTVWGGIHPTLLPEQTLEDDRVDCVVVGDGEHGAVQALSQKTGIINAPRPNLADIPPLSDLLDRWLPPYKIKKYFDLDLAMVPNAVTYLCTRGCPFRCSYCAQPALSGRKVNKSFSDVDFIVQDLLKLKDKYSITGVQFLDEEFLANNIGYDILKGLNGRLQASFQVRMDLLQIFDKRYSLEQLREFGVHDVAPGLETGSSRLLESILKKDETIDCFIEVNKKLSRANIVAAYNFMTGLPTETDSDRLETVSLALKIIDDNPKAVFNTFYTYVPYPKTELWETSIELGFKAPTKLEDWAGFNRHHKITPWTQGKGVKQQLDNLEWSSKFVGKKIPQIFSQDKEIKKLHKHYEKLWRNGDITSMVYPDLNERAKKRISDLFNTDRPEELTLMELE
jgi:radical SAM superfamily enzyme YgiQ (UPF0313 family)